MGLFTADQWIGLFGLFVSVMCLAYTILSYYDNKKK